MERNVSFNYLLHNRLELKKEVDLSAQSKTLKVIDNELWSCQWDGIAVYDDEVKLLRTMTGHGGHNAVESAVLLSNDRVVVAGVNLFISTKSGWCILKHCVHFASIS